MRSMFVKLFFWFWLSTVLSGMVCFLLAINLRLSPRHGGPMHHFIEERRQVVGEALTLYGRNAAALRESGLPVQSAAAQPDRQLKTYLFAADGTPLSGSPPPQMAAAVQRFAARQPLSLPEREHITIVQVAGPSGTRYLAAASGVNFMPPDPPLLGFRLPPDFWLNSGITFLISGLCCYLLAWRLTIPIRNLRAAAQSLAVGNLDARVPVGKWGDELTDLGRDFNSMADRIAKLVASHRQLLRDVSHELRSPLARLGVALGLARKVGSVEVESSLNRIEQESERLNELIGELLELSRLEGSSGSVAFTEVDLTRLVEEVVKDADFEANSQQKRVLITAGAITRLKGDRELLRRALENVVRNGIRYTAPGTAVEVNVEERQAEVRVRVRDHGPGVPEAQLVDIFRPFFRVAEARDRMTGGTGIGLAISQGTVSLHGGKIAARNAEGGGLEVELRLPLNSRASQPILTASMEIEPPSTPSTG